MLRKKEFISAFFLFVFTLLIAPQANSLNLPEAEFVYNDGNIFPYVYFIETINSITKAENNRPYWVYTEDELKKINQTTQNYTSILLNNDILAYYGHPNSRNMGILGRYSIEELDKLLSQTAAEYEAVSGGRKVLKAFYIIFGTVWPKGEIGVIGHDTLMKYIDYGMKNNILVFIDHQIGRYDPIASLKTMLKYLQYPNVHLALDPEWRTNVPMSEIGHMTGEEVNRAQQTMQDYIVENNITGERMLVIHQFNYVMIRNRQVVKSDFARVRLIHCADGFGSPSVKRDSYAYNAQAPNIPIKAFKLFYNFQIPGAGYDNPLMTPKQVYDLKPRPYIIMYQ